MTRLLLLLYPKAFREEYGREIKLSFEAQWRREPSAGLVLRTVWDILQTAAGLHVEMAAQDVRYALRVLRTNPAFASAAVATVALGIGATTATFTLYHEALIKAPPFREPERMVRIVDTNPQAGIQSFSSSIRNFATWQERSSKFESMGAFQPKD
ncbi:MAG: hypothetical protein FJW30_20675, partial [Acidobacteria bacterium]|nr:hypothetical protein [Acidobacteriota bacterium]